MPSRTEQRLIQEAIERARRQGEERERTRLFAALGQQVLAGTVPGVVKAMPVLAPLPPQPQAQEQPPAPGAQSPEGEGAEPNPHQALLLTMLDHAIEAREAGQEPDPYVLQAMAELVRDPDKLADVLGALPPAVHKSYWAMVEKAGVPKSEADNKAEGQVWQGQSGKWFTLKNNRPVPAKAPGGDAAQPPQGPQGPGATSQPGAGQAGATASQPASAGTPGGQPTNPPPGGSGPLKAGTRTKWGKVVSHGGKRAGQPDPSEGVGGAGDIHPAWSDRAKDGGAPQSAREHRAIEASEFRKRFATPGAMTADDFDKVTEHIGTLTIAQLRAARVALGASFGGGKRYAEMRDALQAHCEGRAAELRARAGGQQSQQPQQPKPVESASDEVHQPAWDAAPRDGAAKVPARSATGTVPGQPNVKVTLHPGGGKVTVRGEGKGAADFVRQLNAERAKLKLSLTPDQKKLSFKGLGKANAAFVNAKQGAAPEAGAATATATPAATGPSTPSKPGAVPPPIPPGKGQVAPPTGTRPPKLKAGSKVRPEAVTPPVPAQPTPEQAGKTIRDAVANGKVATPDARASHYAEQAKKYRGGGEERTGTGTGAGDFSDLPTEPAMDANPAKQPAGANGKAKQPASLKPNLARPGGGENSHEGAAVATAPATAKGKAGKSSAPAKAPAPVAAAPTHEARQAILATVKKNAYNARLNDAIGEGEGVHFRNRNLDPKVERQFDAHGTDLNGLSHILTNGIDKNRQFFSEQIGTQGPAGGEGKLLRDGSSFVAVGKPGQSIKNGGVHAVVVDGHHAGSIPHLERAFPGVKFIPAEKSAQGLAELAKGSSGKEVDYGAKPAATEPAVAPAKAGKVAGPKAAPKSRAAKALAKLNAASAPAPEGAAPASLANSPVARAEHAGAIDAAPAGKANKAVAKKRLAAAQTPTEAGAAVKAVGGTPPKARAARGKAKVAAPAPEPAQDQLADPEDFNMTPPQEQGSASGEAASPPQPTTPTIGNVRTRDGAQVSAEMYRPHTEDAGGAGSAERAAAAFSKPTATVAELRKLLPPGTTEGQFASALEKLAVDRRISVNEDADHRRMFKQHGRDGIVAIDGRPMTVVAPMDSRNPVTADELRAALAGGSGGGIAAPQPTEQPAPTPERAPEPAAQAEPSPAPQGPGDARIPGPLHELASAAHAGEDALTRTATDAYAPEKRTRREGGHSNTSDAVNAALRGDHGPEVREAVGRAVDAFHNGGGGSNEEKFARIGRALASAGYSAPGGDQAAQQPPTEPTVANAPATPETPTNAAPEPVAAPEQSPVANAPVTPAPQQRSLRDAAKSPRPAPVAPAQPPANRATKQLQAKQVEAQPVPSPAQQPAQAPAKSGVGRIHDMKELPAGERTRLATAWSAARSEGEKADVLARAEKQRDAVKAKGGAQPAASGTGPAPAPEANKLWVGPTGKTAPAPASPASPSVAKREAEVDALPGLSRAAKEFHKRTLRDAVAKGKGRAALHVLQMAKQESAERVAKRGGTAPATPATSAPDAAPAKAAEPQRHESHQRLKDAIDASPGLTDEHKQQYHAAVDRVAGSLPRAAHDRVAKHMRSVNFHPDPDSVASGVNADPSISAATKAQLKGKRAGGAFINTSGALHVDGADGVAGPHEVHAHELGHAIDGPNHEISKSPEWQRAFKSELATGAKGSDSPLTGYAATKPSEGLAEFSRLVHGSDVPHSQIAKEFPQATKVFKELGLWPDKERTGPETRMPEVFNKDERVELDKKGSHADVLLDNPAAPKESAHYASKERQAQLDAQARKVAGKGTAPAQGGGIAEKVASAKTPEGAKALLDHLAGGDATRKDVLEAAKQLGGDALVARVKKTHKRAEQLDAIRDHLGHETPEVNLMELSPDEPEDERSDEERFTGDYHDHSEDPAEKARNYIRATDGDHPDYSVDPDQLDPDIQRDISEDLSELPPHELAHHVLETSSGAKPGSGHGTARRAAEIAAKRTGDVTHPELAGGNPHESHALLRSDEFHPHEWEGIQHAAKLLPGAARTRSDGSLLVAHGSPLAGAIEEYHGGDYLNDLSDQGHARHLFDSLTTRHQIPQDQVPQSAKDYGGESGHLKGDAPADFDPHHADVYKRISPEHYVLRRSNSSPEVANGEKEQFETVHRSQVPPTSNLPDHYWQGFDTSEANDPDASDNEDYRRLKANKENTQHKRAIKEHTAAIGRTKRGIDKLKAKWHAAHEHIPEDDRPDEPDWEGSMDDDPLKGKFEHYGYHDGKYQKVNTNAYATREDHANALADLRDEYDAHHKGLAEEVERDVVHSHEHHGTPQEHRARQRATRAQVAAHKEKVAGLRDKLRALKARGDAAAGETAGHGLRQELAAVDEGEAGGAHGFHAIYGHHGRGEDPDHDEFPEHAEHAENADAALEEARSSLDPDPDDFDADDRDAHDDIDEGLLEHDSDDHENYESPDDHASAIGEHAEELERHVAEMEPRIAAMEHARTHAPEYHAAAKKWAHEQADRYDAYSEHAARAAFAISKRDGTPASQTSEMRAALAARETAKRLRAVANR